MAQTITAEQLATYYEHDQERLGLDRQSRTLKKSLDVVGKEIKAALLDSGKQSAKRGEHVAELVDGRPYVDWKGEVLKLVGVDKVAEIEAAADVPQRLVVKRAA